MDPSQSTTSTPITTNDSRTPHTKHSYATRIRQNILIKPSARLRQSPDPPTQPRKVKSTPSTKPLPVQASHLPFNIPQFPPPHVVLHPDDANSKVFLAIGRSFLSVDNRAMTIKDLAEMTVKFGLVCQNVSAASQAITTYIRTHMSRCDVQQDCPLLLRHTLSGTASDDDLLPALHSRSGGAHCAASPDNRITNFRRGTMVWYLSRATGAPCPFTRAGIRLCDYGEDGKDGGAAAARERKRQRDRERRGAQCGEKRKRPLRGCVVKGMESDSNDDEPPPKVKLTLRLKPLFRKSPSSDLTSNSGSETRRIIDLSKEIDSDSDDSEDDSMSVDSSEAEEEEEVLIPPPVIEEKEEPWSLPPYPRRSISIPCYTPSTEDYFPSFPSPIPEQSKGPFRRSPSVPYSVGSPPPDSEDEDDDFHITMTGVRRHSVDPSRAPTNEADFDWDADLDSEGDGETVWESPGPRSPSAPIMPNMADIAVKVEPTDVQGMLEAWEDFDSSMAGAKVVEVITQAAASVLEAETKRVKVEALDSWNWESGYPLQNQEWYPSSDELGPPIKQEDFEFDNLLYSTDLHLSPSPISPGSQLSSFHPDSPSTYSSGTEVSHYDNEWYRRGDQFATVRPRAHTTASSFSAFTGSTSSAWTSPETPSRDTAGASKPENLTLPSTPALSLSLATLIQSMSMNSPTSVAPSHLVLPPPCISPNETRCEANSLPDVVVVHTCQPCTPAISATQIEGISVYQMLLGSFSLLRRIDTDFVNLSPIMAYTGAPCPPLATIPNSTVITKGSAAVSGTWVPLAAAQAYVRDHPLQGGPLDIFLSDVLFERFPTALQDFHKSSSPGRMLNHFGPHFGSTLQASRLTVQTDAPERNSWEVAWQQQDAGHSITPHNNFTLSTGLPSCDKNEEVDAPLSATEQEIFHALCVIPDWDKENTPSPNSMLVDEKATAFVSEEVRVDETKESILMDTTATERLDRPLRRSKRVADAALAAQTRTRSRKGTSRSIS
ncbi:hypothetical protein BDZ94DRAFT_1306292 [Collybia nuda]|uniref:GDS1 winged helix domain-containing protein n=1 Tax=Collybia nuda TaxID=64659 RepID=A0A9P6CN29_9AGAR|nr:hypothetical protein BDZ94DRAFT_1306292 [Collybia nuda]